MSRLMLDVLGQLTSYWAMSLSSSLVHRARITPLGGGGLGRLSRPVRALSATYSLYATGCALFMWSDFPLSVVKVLPHSGQVFVSDSICLGIGKDCSRQIRV